MTAAIGSRLLGLEHEYRLLDAAGEPLDMREIGPTLTLDGVRADPGDPHALRTPHGGVVTADGREAEIATPPVRAGVDALDRLAAHGDALLADLLGALGPDRRLEGYSTHLNVEASDRHGNRTAQRLVRRWAPALVLLGLHADSPGLLVRPRWRRLELGVEHLTPPAWRVALVAAAGAVAVAEARDDGGLAEMRVTLEPSRQRFGWYVDRHAFGPDLLADGRSAVLRTRSGRTVRAQDHLEQAWQLARPLALDAFGAGAVDAVDAVVGGDQPLPCERPPMVDPVMSGAPAHLVERRPLTYTTGDCAVRPHALTWRTAVFEVQGPRRTRWIEVPGPDVMAFLAALHAGEYDAMIVAGRVPAEGRRTRRVAR